MDSRQVIPSNQKLRLADKAAHLAVGECLELSYAEARNIVRAVRKLQDGRRWSLLPVESGNFQVWRRA